MQQLLATLQGIDRRFKIIFASTVTLFLVSVAVLLQFVLPVAYSVYNGLSRVAQTHFDNYVLTTTLVVAVVSYLAGYIYLYKRGATTTRRILSLAVLSVLLGFALAVGTLISAALPSAPFAVRFPAPMLMLLLLIECAMHIVAQMVKTKGATN